VAILGVGLDALPVAAEPDSVQVQDEDQDDADDHSRLVAWSATSTRPLIRTRTRGRLASSPVSVESLPLETPSAGRFLAEMLSARGSPSADLPVRLCRLHC
jgi:hypothetical protein